MKQIYWIDDDFAQMFYIIQGVILKLWKLDSQTTDKVRSNIVIFGDACLESSKNELHSLQDQDEKYDSFYHLYMERCRRLDGPDINRPIYRKNKGLVENSVLFLLKRDNHEDIEEYNNIRKIWEESGDDMETDEVRKVAKVQVNKLINRMNIATGAVIGIDISLLHGDIQRINNVQRVISMELYNQLSARKFKCFLYSSEAGEINFVENWKAAYFKYYTVEERLDKTLSDIKIYERKEFLRKGSEIVVSEVKQLLESEK
ncbi:MAG: hypothetical protein J1F02_02595 [Lachnospiraceae bacterium]|nr:hypothetical protein [Lachnospiraceae bacterium]